MEPSTAYPVSFTFDPPSASPAGDRWWRWLLAIPHFIVLYVVQLVASVCVFIAWFAILFTGKLPEGLAGFPMMLIRYQTRS